MDWFCRAAHEFVFDLTGPAKIAKSYVLDAANGQPSRLIIELHETDRADFIQSFAAEKTPQLRPTLSERSESGSRAQPATFTGAAASPDLRPLVVIDPGHGGVDNGTQAGGESEKNLVLGFGLALRDPSKGPANIAS